MAQELMLPNGSKIVVDRIFIGGDRRPNAELRGGQVFITDPGSPAPPRIAMKGKDFFYLTNDLDPVTDKAHVQHLPDNYRGLAEKFIDTRAASTKPLQPVRASAPKPVASVPARTPAKRSHKKRQKATRAPVVIADEESLTRASGGVTVKG